MFAAFGKSTARLAVKTVEFTLEEIARHVGGEVVGDPKTKIRRVAPITSASEGDITFISNPKYLKALESTSASAVIVPPKVVSSTKNLVVSENSYLAFAKTMEMIYGRKPRPDCGVSGGAHVDPGARIGADVNIFPGAFVDSGASIGDRCDLYPGVFVGANAEIGEDSLIYPNVSILEGCRIGARAIIHAGTVIGSDGFGFARDGDSQHKIPQIGNVVVEDDVEIGANCAVDRAVLGSTVIGRGTKMDNLIQIGHNAVIGPNCTIVAQVGISGSTKIGTNTVIAGQVGITGHIEIGDNVEIGAKSGVISSIPSNEKYLGIPAAPINTARKAYALFYDIPVMFRDLSRLRKEVESLRKALEGK